MKTASLTQLRRNLSDILNAVINDREPLLVSRRRGKPVVVMSLEDFEALNKAAALPATKPAAPTPVRPAAPRRVSTSAVGRLLRSFSEVDEISFMPKPTDAPETAGRP